MKKYLLITCMAFLTCTVAFAGKNEGKGQKQHGGSTAFSTDITITSAFDQSAVKLATAFNGWQYAAVSTFDFNNFEGGFRIRMSKDGGVTWTNVDSYSQSLQEFTSMDLVVAGSDTNSLTLYVAGVAHDMSNNSYTVYVDAYNGATGTSIGSKVNTTDMNGPITSVAIASDYANPAFGASPYSVGILYNLGSDLSGESDSLIFTGSVDGGSNWNVRHVVAHSVQSDDYFRKVALAYGKGLTASNGNYYCAYELLKQRTNATGSIFTSRTDSAVDLSWTTPYGLDSIVPEQYGLLSNPSIAVQSGSTDNDSSSVTAVVLVDYDFEGDQSDFDVIGFYNKVAHSTDFWNELDILSTTDNDMQPDVVYNAGKSTFEATYFDVTNHALPYITNDVNLTSPDDWTYNSDQYNDATAGLTNAQPQVSVNPFSSLCAFAWIQNDGTHDLALFDQDDGTVSVKNAVKTEAGLTVYPNPAVHDMNVTISLKSASRVNVEIFNSMGQLMIVQNLGTLETGVTIHPVNIESLTGGNYFVRITGDRFTKTEKLIIAKQ